MKQKIYAGIDPGADGFLTFLNPNLSPDNPDFLTFFSFDKESPYVIADALDKFNSEYDLVVCMEDVHSVHGSSAKSNFMFGFNTGQVTGFLIAHGIKFVKVAPKDWQREIWTNPDKVKKAGKIDTKKTSIQAAQRLFPKADLRKTPRSSTPHDGKCDSLLMAEYGRRKNL